jgi:hypothetical protein
MATSRSVSLLRWRRDAVRRMRGARAATLAFVGRLPEPDALRPRTIDRWSVKDVLAHLMTCDEETVRRLKLIARGHGDRIHWFETMEAGDRFNARSVAGARRLGLGAVLRRMARVHADLVKRISRLPVGALRDPSHKYPVTDWLPAPGWSHEREHLAEIRAWWRRQRRGRSAR